MMKNLLIVCALALACAATATKPLQEAGSYPALEFVKRLAGGQWTGQVGTMPVSLRFESVFDGKVVEGNGTVGDPSKPALKMFSRIGIDPATKSVYYVDLHNAEGVLFGHCTIEKDLWKCDFRSLAGGSGHWVTYAKFLDADTYESTMYQIDKDGKEARVHTLTLKRTKG